MPLHILCTGGCGFIGSHTVVKLVEKGYLVTVLDNVASTIAENVIQKIKKITGTKVQFVHVDLKEKDAVVDCMSNIPKIDAVIHYAALKAVGESTREPLSYYHNNVTGMIHLLQAMKLVDCKTLVFSSSATVYQPNVTGISEESPIGASNPYGQTKVMCEQILKDLAHSDDSWKFSLLRYFNPIGAHSSGMLGEEADEPRNILPVIEQAAFGQRKEVTVFGNDYAESKDGTGIRDYLHIEDLVEGHICAIEHLEKKKTGCTLVHNLGTGKGTSVLDMISAYEAASGMKVPYTIGERRPGDLGRVVADCSKAEKDFSWKATRTIEQACQDSYRYKKASMSSKI
eukprot:Filipodium_phascolosomae@DN157_c0_g1_i1.p1